MTFDDKRYLLISIAQKYANRLYEVDELVNEAWLSRHVREATETPILWMAGRWAMITYMHKMQKDNRKAFKVTFRSLSCDDNYGGLFIDPPTPVCDCLMVQDDLEYMVRNLSNRDKTVMQMKLSGAYLREIGKKLGITRERVRQIWYSIQAKMRIRYAISLGDVA